MSSFDDSLDTFRKTLATELEVWHEIYTPALVGDALKRRIERETKFEIPLIWVQYISEVASTLLNNGTNLGTLRILGRGVLHGDMEIPLIPAILSLKHPDKNIMLVSPDMAWWDVVRKAVEATAPHSTMEWVEEGGYGPTFSTVNKEFVVVHPSHPLVELPVDHPFVIRWMNAIPTDSIIGFVENKSNLSAVDAIADAFQLENYYNDDIAAIGSLNLPNQSLNLRLFRSNGYRVSDDIAVAKPEKLESGRLKGKTVVVVGSNLGGLSGALCLARNGAKVVLLEPAPFLGRVCHTFEIDSCLFDMGEHIFTYNYPETNEFWHSIFSLEDFIPVHYRHGNFADGKLTPAIQSVRNLALFRGRADLNRFLSSWEQRDQDALEVEKWAPLLADVYRSRSKWFTDLFVSGYYRQRNARDWDKLLESSLTGPIRGFQDANPESFNQLLDSEIVSDQGDVIRRNICYHNSYSETSSSRTRYKYALDAVEARAGRIPFTSTRAFYPRHGSGALTKELERRLNVHGVDIKLSTGLRAIEINSDRRITSVVTADGETLAVDHVLAADTVEVIKASGLPIGQTVVKSDIFVIYVALAIARTEAPPYTTILHTEVNSPIARVTTFKYWSPDMVLKSDRLGFGVELRNSPWTSLSRFETMKDEEILEEILETIIKMGLMERDELLSWRIFRVPKKSPVVPDELVDVSNLHMLNAVSLAGITSAGLKLADGILNSESTT